MKLLKQILLILLVFSKTGNLLSDNNLFNVNNISIEKKENISNKQLANQAIKEAFNQLIGRVLMKEDQQKLYNLSFSKINELVKYYNISKNTDTKIDKVNFNITFDRGKIHDLFYRTGLLYSDIADKEFFILPVVLNENEIFIFSNNYFYENWNKSKNKKLIEFILPIENIEIIQKINKSRENLFNLELKNLFEEYPNKNIAFVLIENNENIIQKIYLKSIIHDKAISKNLTFKKNNLETEILNKKIILEVEDELVNLVKSRNLIDIRTPSFLNVIINLDKIDNLASINKKIKNIDLIENIYVQDFTKNYVKIKIKYLGKLERIVDQLRKENLKLELIDEEWFIKTF